MKSNEFTPTLDELRGFVRKQITSDLRKSIYRWLVACPDPTLPSILFNLQLEWEQIQKDDKLSCEWRELGAFFLHLWESEAATLDSFAPEPRAKQSLQYAGFRSGFEGVRLWRHDDGSKIVAARTFDVDVVVPARRRRAFALWTSDAEGPEKFFDSGMSGSLLPFEYERSDGRVTFWYVAADDPATLGVVPTTARLFLEWVRRIHQEPNCTIRAVRLTSRALSDLYE